MSQIFRRGCRWVVTWSTFAFVSAVLAQSSTSQMGREVAIPRHLQDGEEFTTPLNQLIQYGAQLFSKWGGLDKAKACFPDLQWS